MNTLLSIIVFWLSVNFGLPANYAHPRVAYVPATEMDARRMGRLEALQAGSASQARPGARAAVAIYDDRTKTIYLRDDWTGTTAAELSILVHELVHHLQNLAGLRYACPREREALAYAAQERWLKLFGGSLERDFEVDRFTLLVSTNCAY